MIGRRRFIVTTVLGMVSARYAEAQPPAKPARIGVLRPAPDDPVFRKNFEFFPQALHEARFVEGKNLTLEYRVRPGNLEELAGELAQLKMDAILAISAAAVRAAAKATRSIPIVAVDLETDPVVAGLAASAARPQGNLTGLFLSFPELSGKWMELLKEAVPGLVRVGVLWDPATGRYHLDGVEPAARALRLQLVRQEARNTGDLAGAFRAAGDARAGAMVVLSSPVLNSARRHIAELAAKHRMPTIMPFPGFAEDGGFMAYGPDLPSMFRQAAGVMVKVLRGTPPGDIPIERPARFEFVINLKTAKALGLTIPGPLLVRADRLLE